MVGGRSRRGARGTEHSHAGYLEQGDKCHTAEMALQLVLPRIDHLGNPPSGMHAQVSRTFNVHRVTVTAARPPGRA